MTDETPTEIPLRGLPRARDLLSRIETASKLEQAIARAKHAQAIATVEAASVAQARLLLDVLLAEQRAVGSVLDTDEEADQMRRTLRLLLGLPPVGRS